MTLTIDGHDLKEIIKAFDKAREQTKKPTAIIAKTLKGKFFKEEIEN